MLRSFIASHILMVCCVWAAGLFSTIIRRRGSKRLPDMHNQTRAEEITMYCSGPEAEFVGAAPFR